MYSIYKFKTYFIVTVMDVLTESLRVYSVAASCVDFVPAARQPVAL